MNGIENGNQKESFGVDRCQRCGGELRFCGGLIKKIRDGLAECQRCKAKYTQNRIGTHCFRTKSCHNPDCVDSKQK